MRTSRHSHFVPRGDLSRCSKILYSITSSASASSAAATRRVGSEEFVERDVMERGAESAGSICLDACELHPPAPLVDFLDEELAEVSRRAWEHRATQVGQARLHLRIGK